MIETYSDLLLQSLDGLVSGLHQMFHLFRSTLGFPQTLVNQTH